MNDIGDTVSVADSTKADHICVLVHGLWGNPSHLNNVSKVLRQRHPADRLHILVAKRNSSNRTYDGVEVGGERLAQEIEDELSELAARGNHITKLSIVGYSFGGLVARYCIGLLFSRGWFDDGKLEPVNFTAFASPFLGARAPTARGLLSAAYNAVASRMVSVSGRQLFLVDSYRGSGRPLLEVMTDPESIFVAGLKRFRNRAVYANAVNDLSAPWFTAGFARIDPFVDLGEVQLNYAEGHDSVVLDSANPVQRKKVESSGAMERVYSSGASFVNSLPFYVLVAVTLPISLTALTVNCGIQSISSNRRVLQHNSGKVGNFEAYRVPYLMESALKTLANAKAQASLTKSRTSPTVPSSHAELEDSDSSPKSHTNSTALLNEHEEKQLSVKHEDSISDFPTLALNSCQERMIEALNSIGFHKYPVLITKIRQSHAAIIVRRDWKSMEEGYVVLQHWLDHEFNV